MEHQKTKTWGVLVCLFLLAGCSNNLYNLKEGQSLPSSEGLLVGTIRWQQGDQGLAVYGGGVLGSKVRMDIRNVTTDEVYSYVMEAPDVRLALPPGQYTFVEISVSNVAVNVNRTTAQKVAPWLLNLLTLPLGVVTIPTGKVNLSFKPPFPPFVIREHEALYIGSLVINLPDPLPRGRFQARFDISDEGDQVLSELQDRFPGTKRVEKRLLNEM